MIDLHMHSTYSDGSQTPEQLILEAKAKGQTSQAIEKLMLAQELAAGPHLPGRRPARVQRARPVPPARPSTDPRLRRMTPRWRVPAI